MSNGDEGVLPKKEELRLLIGISERLSAVETNNKNLYSEMRGTKEIMQGMQQTLQQFGVVLAKMDSVQGEMDDIRKDIKCVVDSGVGLDHRMDKLETAYQRIDSMFLAPLSKIFWYIFFGVIGAGLVAAIMFGLQKVAGG